MPEQQILNNTSRKPAGSYQSILIAPQNRFVISLMLPTLFLVMAIHTSAARLPESLNINGFSMAESEHDHTIRLASELIGKHAKESTGMASANAYTLPGIANTDKGKYYNTAGYFNKTLKTDHAVKRQQLKEAVRINPGIVPLITNKTVEANEAYHKSSEINHELINSDSDMLTMLYTGTSDYKPGSVEEHITQINRQTKKLQEIEKQNVILTLTLILITLMSLWILILHFRDRWYSIFHYHKIRLILAALKKKNDKTPSCDGAARIEEIYTQIIQLFEKRKLFLDSNLTLTSLAIELHTNEKYISKAINKHSKSNFVSFINKYRITEACRIMLTNENNYKISVLSKQAGFGDPSTFYRHFKELTGMTPRQFSEINKINVPTPFIVPWRLRHNSGTSRELFMGKMFREVNVPA